MRVSSLWSSIMRQTRTTRTFNIFSQKMNYEAYRTYLHYQSVMIGLAWLWSVWLFMDSLAGPD